METEKTKTHPVAVIIPYNKNETGLAVLLATLQAQLIPPQKIIIVDTSGNHSGYSIAKRYYTNTVDVVVEYVKGANIYEAWNRGIDLAKGLDCIIINDDVLVPMNFVDVMYTTGKITKAYCIVPETPSKEHYKKTVDMPYSWWAAVPDLKKQELEAVQWMPGFVYMLTAKCIKEVGVIDNKFKIWYGDDDYQTRILKRAAEVGGIGIVKVKSAFVYHYGGSSYKYNSNPELMKIINEDKNYYIAKWSKELKETKKKLEKAPAKK